MFGLFLGFGCCAAVAGAASSYLVTKAMLRAHECELNSQLEVARAEASANLGSPMHFADLSRHFSMDYAQVVATPAPGLGVVKELGQLWGIVKYKLVYDLPAEMALGQRFKIKN